MHIGWTRSDDIAFNDDSARNYFNYGSEKKFILIQFYMCFLHKRVQLKVAMSSRRDVFVADKIINNILISP